MKKFTAILLALVMILTCVATVACNSIVLVYLENYDGSKTKTQVYNPDEALPKPVRDGYIFGGWFTDKELTKPFEDGTEMKSNFHLYAKWLPMEQGGANEIHITFVYCDGVTADKVTASKAGQPFSSVLSTGPNPTREGYRFDGWWTAETGGEQMLTTTLLTVSMPVYAHWTYVGSGQQGGGDTLHTTHDFGNSYFMYVKCSYASCNVYGRNEVNQKYVTLSDYTLEGRMSTITAHYNSLVTNISSGSNQTQFDTLYDQYYADVDEVVEQYEIIYLLSDIDTSLVDKCYDAGDYYDLTIARFYGLYELIYNSNYRSYFYSGWTSDDIQEARDLAAMYNDSSQDQAELRSIMEEYNELLEEMGDYELTPAQISSINALYGRLVTANNAIAVSAGYSGNRNYMDYAYENVYYREYGPSDVATMRNYVKNVIAPIFVDVAEEYYEFYQYNSYGMYFSNTTNSNYFEGLTELSVVDTVSSSASNANTVRDTVNYIGNYYKYLSEVNGIDFSGEANNLFKNGNYFTGDGEGAYTTVIKSKPIVYFQTDYYSTAFTFVHEFGHYYDFVYNGSLTASMDHSETQSQGDEMLFLAWLSQNKPSGITDGYTAVELNQLFDFLSTVILATAVDELEQAAYSGYYNGAAITDYNQTFVDIMSTYSGADEYLNTDYWMYVVFDNAAYYISYAMSALPALEIFAKAGNDGLNAARDSYLKLFTYSSNSSFLGSDEYGGATVTASYQTILNWCGLHSAFQSQLYTTIQNYFNSRS